MRFFNIKEVVQATACCCLLLTIFLGEMRGAVGRELPLPGLKIPDSPVLRPMVITAGGQRLLLNHTDVRVAFAKGKLFVNRKGWWVINFPLSRIEGLQDRSADDIAMLLFNKPTATVKNWYFMTPGQPAPEPAAPTGPAPIDVTPNPTKIVNNAHPKSSDTNPGTKEAPLKTIAAAVEDLKAGDVVHVYPGIYREAFVLKTPGTAGNPIRIEGIRSKDGKMPVITGNDLFPPNAWKPVKGLEGVYRTDMFTKLAGGMMSNDGRTLIERSLPSDLKANEYCINRASPEFLTPQFDGKLDGVVSEEQAGQRWRKIDANAEGFLDLADAYGDEAKEAIFWVSAYVWMPPEETDKVKWDPRFPEPVSRRAFFGGRFRAYRMAGTSMSGQVNKFQVWANEQRIPSCTYNQVDDDSEYREFGRPDRMYGFREIIDNFPFREGWNHLVFELDTSLRPDETLFQVLPPYKIQDILSVAAKPKDLTRPAGTPSPHVPQYMVLGPFPAGKPDKGIYVRLAGDIDPNTQEMDFAARRDTLVSIEASFVHLRGFEVRHGTQFQQREQVFVFGYGSLLEGCLLRDNEFTAVTYSSILKDLRTSEVLSVLDQSGDPIVIRNNWIINSGNTGIAGRSSSDYLTPENLNTDAKGRARVIVEHNHIVNPNWTGIRPFWGSGGMKLFCLTQSVIRRNTIIGGTGPSIWLDWEHYGNRLEGNMNINGWSMLIGVEASPGPHLMANNLSINLRPGESWFRSALLSWNSGRNWCVNNTVDGRWNSAPAWQNQKGGAGINVGSGDGNRPTLFGELTERNNVHMNNIAVGCKRELRMKPGDISVKNLTESGTDVEYKGSNDIFVDAKKINYRLQKNSPLNRSGTRDNRYTDRVKHDFFGLLRFDQDGRTLGAFRAERASTTGATLIELETTDGEAMRLYEPVKAD